VSISSTPLHILPTFSILFIYLCVKVINNKILSLVFISCIFYMIISLFSL
jgi:hypothetical protein